MLDCGEGTTFALSYREVQKIKSSKNRDSNVITCQFIPVVERRTL